MRIRLTHVTNDGKEFGLELSCDDLTREEDKDLDTNQARTAIMSVLDRELRRCAEIATVAIQDAHMARRRAAVPPPATKAKRGPDMILAAGNKDAKTGRVMLDQRK